MNVQALIESWNAAEQELLNHQLRRKKNSIPDLYPYKHEGLWVFDDPDAGLRGEPLISGAGTMVDRMTAGITGADQGFRLQFSPTPLPGPTVKLEWRRSESGGNCYWCQQMELESCLCPALFKYFTEPPKELYVRAEQKVA